MYAAFFGRFCIFTYLCGQIRKHQNLNTHVTMTELQSQLFGMQDKEYAAFQAKLTPDIPRERFIGVRVPQLRAFAKAFAKDPAHEAFLQTLPHAYYDEDMLHALLLSQMRDY